MTHLQSFPDAQQPTARQVSARTNLVIQAWRFAMLNIKMLTMVRKGHH